jgi:hypothetical protein
MKYHYRIEYIESLKKICFIESDDRRDLLAIREDHLIDFKKNFIHF